MNPIKDTSGRFKKVYSKKTIIKYLKKVSEKIGGSPTYRDLEKIPGPNPTTIIRHFGSWSKALKAAGIRPKTNQLKEGEKKFIRKNWKTMTDKEIALEIGISLPVVRYYRMSSKLWKNTRNKKLTKATQKKLAIKKYGNSCEICNIPIVELHHIVPRSKKPTDWAVLCPLCHSVITRKIIKVKDRKELFSKLKPYIKSVYSELKL